MYTKGSPILILVSSRNVGRNTVCSQLCICCLLRPRFPVVVRDEGSIITLHQMSAYAVEASDELDIPQQPKASRDEVTCVDSPTSSVNDVQVGNFATEI